MSNCRSTQATNICTPQTASDANGQLRKPRTGKQVEIGQKDELLDKRLNGHAALFCMADGKRPMKGPNNPRFSMVAGQMRS